MRLFIIALVWAIGGFTATGQELGDTRWLLGYGPPLPDMKFGGTLLDFSQNDLNSIEYVPIQAELARATGSICNSNGDLLLYTDGCRIYNAGHDVIENSDSLNYPGKQYTQNCALGFGYSTDAGTLVLPVPGSAHRYVVIHLRDDTDPAVTVGAFHYPRSLLSTEVDMAANQGRGLVTRKNEVLLRDTFADMLAVVRHGNGRDWWIAAPRLDAPKIFLFLLTPQGIEGPFERATPLPWRHDYRWFSRGQAVFSPDGTRYARLDSENGFQVYDFDRCNGEFSRGIRIDMSNDTLDAAGAAFSPSGRFLYASTGKRMYQVDLGADDPNASKYLLGVYDGFRCAGLFWTTFYQQRLAPDGKIYMSCTNGAYYLHVVQAPDRYRDSCGFEQHALELPSYNGFTLPNFPNFRLYDWAGSPCDTAGVTAPAGRQTIWPGDMGLRIVPNPVQDYATIALPNSAYGPVRIYTAAGALLRVLPDVIVGEAYRFAVWDWPAGVYVVVVADRVAGRRAGRLVIRY